MGPGRFGNNRLETRGPRSLLLAPKQVVSPAASPQCGWAWQVCSRREGQRAPVDLESQVGVLGQDRCHHTQYASLISTFFPCFVAGTSQLGGWRPVRSRSWSHLQAGSSGSWHSVQLSLLLAQPPHLAWPSPSWPGAPWLCQTFTVGLRAPWGPVHPTAHRAGPSLSGLRSAGTSP